MYTLAFIAAVIATFALLVIATGIAVLSIGSALKLATHKGLNVISSAMIDSPRDKAKMPSIATLYVA